MVDMWGRLRSAKRLSCALTRACGLDIPVLCKRLKQIPRFGREYRQFKLQLPDGDKVVPSFPILQDYEDNAGTAMGHYFHQDLWAARKIYAANPARHVDIGSRIDGFVSHLLVFRDVEVVDIRPLASDVKGLSFVQADATHLNGFADNSVISLSSLHAAEHFGLGRYGDPIDAQAHLKFMAALQRVLKPQGRLYFSVPVGRESIAFNAHRVLSPKRVIDAFSGLKLLSFSAINDQGDFIEDARWEDFSSADFSCGLFEFMKG